MTGSAGDSGLPSAPPAVKLNLGGITNGPGAAADPFASNYGAENHLIYPDSSGTLWDAVQLGSGAAWELRQLNQGGKTLGMPSSGEVAASTFNNFFSQYHIVYADAAGAIWDIWNDSLTQLWIFKRST